MDLEQMIQQLMKQYNVPRETVASWYVGKGPDGRPLFNVPRQQGPSVGDRLKGLLDETNAANDKRYGEALGINAQSKTDQLSGLDAEYGKLFGLLNAGTDEARQRERMQTSEELGGVQADLASHGLNNTTIRYPMEQEIRDRSSLREREIDADNARREIGVRSHYIDERQDALRGADSQRIGIIESQSDMPPNLGLYASLLSQPTGGYVGGGAHSSNPMANGGGGFGGFGNVFANPLRAPTFEVPSAGANPYGGKVPNVTVPVPSGATSPGAGASMPQAPEGFEASEYAMAGALGVPGQATTRGAGRPQPRPANPLKSGNPPLRPTPGMKASPGISPGLLGSAAWRLRNTYPMPRLPGRSFL